MKPIPTNRKISGLEILQYIVLISILLYFGKSLFIPLSFAILISCILYPVCKLMEKKGINSGVAIFISIFGMFVVLCSVVYLFFLQIIAFSNEWQFFRVKLLETAVQMSSYLSEQFNLSSENQIMLLKNVINNSGTQAISLLQNTLYSLSESVFYLIIIPVYSILILYYRQLFVHALYHIFPSEKRETIREILVETIHAYYNFIKGMGMVYLIVGILNSIGLAIIGIPHPILFGFTASILTFIPYVGILISGLLPIAVSWITFNSIWYPIGVVIVFSLVQLLEAYIIFPYAVGSRLKINTLVIIMVISIGGILWGAAGMILFIPFVSITKLIADRTKGLKTLAIILGDGEPNDNELEKKI
jgi:predicted PurR-regulated permease PerM